MAEKLGFGMIMDVASLPRLAATVESFNNRRSHDCAVVAAFVVDRFSDPIVKVKAGEPEPPTFSEECKVMLVSDNPCPLAAGVDYHDFLGVLYAPNPK